MPEIEFTINAATGQLEMHVHGVAGPACDDVAKLTKELLGDPGREINTSDYYVRPTVRPQIRPEQRR